MQRPPSTIHVVLADDHHLVRSGIRSLLSTLGNVRVIAEVADGAELLRLLEEIHPDVVITDISMPGTDGLDAISQIRTRHPDLRVIVLSMHDEPDVIKRAFANGASAYLRKDASDFELASALESVMITGSYISAPVARILAQPSDPAAEDILTRRQIEILKLLAKGMSSKEIGYALGLSPKTVDVHRSRLMERLDLRDVASLTIYAVRHGLIKL